MLNNWTPLVYPISLLFLFVIPTMASGPNIPPWKRSLTDAQYEKVGSDITKLLALRCDGKFDDAIKAGNKVVEFLSKEQGNDHWHAEQARELVEVTRILKTITKKQHQAFEDSLLQSEFVTAQKLGKLKAAAAFAKDNFELSKTILGAAHGETLRRMRLWGGSLYDSRQYKEAESVLLKAKAFFEQRGDDPHKAYCFNSLGIVTSHLEKHEQALKYFEEALRIDSVVFAPNELTTIEHRTNFAEALSNARQFVKAKSELELVRKVVVKEFGDPSYQLCQTEMKLAENDASRFEFRDAQDRLGPVLQLLLQNAPKSRLAVECKKQIARLLPRLGQHTAACLFFEEAIRSEPKNPADLIPIRSQYANSLLALGNPVAAEAQLRENLKYCKKTWHRPTLATVGTHYSLGVLLNGEGKKKDAKSSFRQAIEMGEAMESPELEIVISARSALARLMMKDGELAPAERLVKKNAKLEKVLSPATRLLVQQNAARLIFHRGDVAAAEQTMAAALSAAEAKEMPIEVRLNCQRDRIAYLSHLGKWSECVKVLTVAKQKLSASNDAKGDAENDVRERFATGDDLATSLIKLERPTDAWNAYEAAKALILRNNLAMVERLTDEEFTKRRKLNDEVLRIDKRLQSIISSKPKELANAEKRRQEAIESARVAVSESKKELADFYLELRKKHRTTVEKSFDLKRVQKTIRPETALVSWLDVGTGKSDIMKAGRWACVVRKTGAPVWINLYSKEGGWKPDESDVNVKLLKSISTFEGMDYEAHAQTAFRQRLGPVLPYLKARDGLPKVERLVVIPNRPTGRLPVECLVSETGRRVLDDYLVCYAPSATLYCKLKEREWKQRDPSLFAVVDPDGTLTRSRDTAAVVKDWFKDHSVLIGTDASESALADMSSAETLNSFTHLHFGAHGQASIVPMQSAILLASAKTNGLVEAAQGRMANDGRLTAEEITTWRLNADIVTVASCKSNLGWHSRNEGYVGLSQAFLLAGARSLVVSLWDVDDDATSLLMSRFYSNLLGKNGAKPLSKVAALREAKLWLSSLVFEDARKQLVKRGVDDPLKDFKIEKATGKTMPYAHPAYWAGFILLGDPGNDSEPTVR